MMDDETECPACDGEGQWTCDYCFGGDDDDCPNCYGGLVRCYLCGGTGRVSTARADQFEAGGV